MEKISTKIDLIKRQLVTVAHIQSLKSINEGNINVNRINQKH